MQFPVERLRAQFPALARRHNGESVAYFDGPAGTQVPQRVLDAVTATLRDHNANRGGRFASSVEADAIVETAHRKVAALLNAEPREVVFGQNMTSLAFHLSRSLAETWSPGDRIVVTRIDHDANITPWALAAERRGVIVDRWDIRESDCTLDVAQLDRLLTPRTRLVAVALASNAVGTIHPVAEIVRRAKSHGARVVVDAVHYAPHGLIDVAALGCDFLLCSAYKFFGPHQGILWGRAELLESLRPHKLRPVNDTIPDRWMTGTQSHEGLAGVAAAIDYLADVGRESGAPDDDRTALATTLARLGAYEQGLSKHFLERLRRLPDYRLYGIADLNRLSDRVPTFGLTHQRRSARELAEQLGQRGMFAWHGNFYALALTERLRLEPDGMLRLGFVHTTTVAEIDRLCDALASLG